MRQKTQTFFYFIISIRSNHLNCMKGEILRKKNPKQQSLGQVFFLKKKKYRTRFVGYFPLTILLFSINLSIYT